MPSAPAACRMEPAASTRSAAPHCVLVPLCQASDGSVYTGGWQNDLKHGLGRKEYASGDVYEASPRNSESGHACNGHPRVCRCGLMCAYAAAFSQRAWLSQGLWKADKPDGPGRYCWKNDNEYDGEWRNGTMHGQGTMKWASGAQLPQSAV